MRRVQIAFFSSSLSFVLSIALTTLPTYATDRCGSPGFQLSESLLSGTAPVAITMGDFGNFEQAEMVKSSSSPVNIEIGFAKNGTATPTAKE